MKSAAFFIIAALFSLTCEASYSRSSCCVSGKIVSEITSDSDYFLFKLEADEVTERFASRVKTGELAVKNGDVIDVKIPKTYQDSLYGYETGQKVTIEHIFRSACSDRGKGGCSRHIYYAPRYFISDKQEIQDLQNTYSKYKALQTRISDEYNKNDLIYKCRLPKNDGTDKTKCTDSLGSEVFNAAICKNLNLIKDFSDSVISLYEKYPKFKVMKTIYFPDEKGIRQQFKLQYQLEHYSKHECI